MGRILEHHAKQLLMRAGVPVLRGAVAGSPEEAHRLAEEMGGWVVVKALVPVGRRGKAGAVQLVERAEKAAEAAGRLIGDSIGGYPVERVLVEQAAAVERELYFAVLVDKRRQTPLALASSLGGVEIEEIVAREPSALHEATLDPWGRVFPHQLRQIWAALGLQGQLLAQVADISYRVVRLFFELDTTLVEINPLAIVKEASSADGTGGHNGSTVEDGAQERRSIVALSAVMVVDDAALARHPDLEDIVQRGTDRLWRAPTELEQRAMEVATLDPYRGTARFIQLDGDIGFLCGGGGGSLVFFDALLRAGGRPACYTEFGGNPTAEKVRGLTKIVLSCPGVRGLLVGHNITNNTQVNLVAQGVVAALHDLGLDTRRFPVVAREVGTYDIEGQRIFQEAGVEYLGEDVTMEEAAYRIVERVYGRR